VIFFSFITLGSASGNESTGCAADRADDNDFSAFDEAKDHVSDFAFSVRSANEGRALNYPSGISEINVMIAQIRFIFSIIPLERTDIGEQFRVLIG
jgi:hypothetical protein